MWYLFYKFSLNVKTWAKISIYRSIFVPSLTYGHEGWVMTERIRLQIRVAEMGFLRRVAGVSLRDKVRSSVIWEELEVEWRDYTSALAWERLWISQLELADVARQR